MSDRRFCLYFTTNTRDGSFYIGKGLTENVRSGKYKGSGVKILNALKKNPGIWSAFIIAEDLTNEEALQLEEALVNEELLKNPRCMNLIKGGGRRTDGDPTYQLSRGQKISATRKERMKDPAFKAIYLEALKKGNRTMSTNAKNTKYTLVFADTSLEFDSQHQLRAFCTKNALAHERTGRKTHTVTGDKGWFFQGERFVSKAEAKKAARRAAFHQAPYIDGNEVKLVQTYKWMYNGEVFTDPKVLAMVHGTLRHAETIETEEHGYVVKTRVMKPRGKSGNPGARI